MIKVMLDTCVLIDFYLVYLKEYKRRDIPDSLKRPKELLIRLENAKFHNVMSYWNKWEFRQVLMNMRLQEKFILEGYNIKEFGDAKKEISLTSNEISLVNKAVFDLWKFCIRNTINFDKEDYITIEALTKEGYTYMDIGLTP